MAAASSSGKGFAASGDVLYWLVRGRVRKAYAALRIALPFLPLLILLAGCRLLPAPPTKDQARAAVENLGFTEVIIGDTDPTLTLRYFSARPPDEWPNYNKTIAAGTVECKADEPCRVRIIERAVRQQQ